MIIKGLRQLGDLLRRLSGSEHPLHIRQHSPASNRHRIKEQFAQARRPKLPDLKDFLAGGRQRLLLHQEGSARKSNATFIPPNPRLITSATSWLTCWLRCCAE